MGRISPKFTFRGIDQAINYEILNKRKCTPCEENRKKNLKKRLVYVSYATRNTKYEENISNLKESLEKFNLPHEIFIDDPIVENNWARNAGFKTVALIRAMYKHPNRPLVWMDSDLVIKEYPKLFYEMDCDIAYSNRHSNDELLPSIVYIGYSARSHKILLDWFYGCMKFAGRGKDCDQTVLKRVLFDAGVKVFKLPHEYGYVKNHMPVEEGFKPVITHTGIPTKWRKVKSG